MSALLTTFRPDSLAGVGVDIDHCDGEIGATLAMVLSELGARVDMRGDDDLELRKLQASITDHWGQGRIICGPAEQETLIRIFHSAEDASAFLLSPAPASGSRTIAILAAQEDADVAMLAEIARRGETRGAHILALPHVEAFDAGALAAVIAFLLSPAAEDLGGQYLRLPQATRSISLRARRPAYPDMPVCAPAVAS